MNIYFHVRHLSKYRSIPKRSTTCFLYGSWITSSQKMERPTVYITRPDIPEIAIDLLKEKFDVEMWTSQCPVPREEFKKQVQGKDALFCVLTDKIDTQLLDAAGPMLKVIGTMSVGYDHIDVLEVKQRGIKLGYTPNVLTDAVAELTIGLLLATSRRMFEAHQHIVNGTWEAWSPVWMCGAGLKGSTVGIVGFGRIGQEVAKRLKCFNVGKLVYTARSEKSKGLLFDADYVTMDQLLGESDFVIVTCSLNPQTSMMFNDDLFNKMKKNAVFINTSRGGVVDHSALQRALEDGKIFAAGLDVMTPEPLPVDSPLLKLKNCVILPHIGSATIQARRDMAVLTACNIICGLQGRDMPAEVK